MNYLTLFHTQHVPKLSTVTSIPLSKSFFLFRSQYYIRLLLQSLVLVHFCTSPPLLALLCLPSFACPPLLALLCLLFLSYAALALLRLVFSLRFLPYARPAQPTLRTISPLYLPSSLPCRLCSPALPPSLHVLPYPLYLTSA